MSNERFVYVRTRYRHYIQDIQKDGEYKNYYRGSYDEFDLDKITKLLNQLNNENEQLKKDDNLFFGKVFDILLKYQDLFNREMADEVLEELGIELTRWFE